MCSQVYENMMPILFCTRSKAACRIAETKTIAHMNIGQMISYRLNQRAAIQAESFSFCCLFSISNFISSPNVFASGILPLLVFNFCEKIIFCPLTFCLQLCPPERRSLYGRSMVCPREEVTLWVVHGVPQREGNFMGGPWCAPERR